MFFNNEVIAVHENPINWWLSNEKNPFLLPKLIFGCLLSVASERKFLSAGKAVAPSRERLLSAHVEEIVFLHHNVNLLHRLLKSKFVCLLVSLTTYLMHQMSVYV